MPPNQNQFPAPQQPVPPQQPMPPQQPVPNGQPQPVQQFPPQPGQPQQQWPAAPQQPDQQTPGKYDFFMAPQKPQKSGLLGGGGLSGAKLYLVAAGIVGVLAVIGIIVAAAIGGQKQPSPLLGIVQTQQELIRVAALGSKSTKSTNLQNFAVTARVSLASEQQAALAQLKKQGISPKTKTLEATKNAKTDQALSAALAANTYDTTFASTMETELDDYQAKLENATALATTTAERALIQKQLGSAELLEKQLQSR